MNKIYVINTQKNQIAIPSVMEHIKAGIEENGMIYEPLILNEKDPFHIQFQKLSDISQWDAIITIDFAGFEAETEMGNAYYNILPVRMAHLLITKDIQCPESLRGRINFSMFFYCVFYENALGIKKNYNHIENVSYKEELSVFVSQQKSDSYGAVMLEVFRDMQLV